MEERLSYGGQAIIEGVMMRGTQRVAMAARTPEGEIRLRTEPLNPTLYGGPLTRIPVLRGLITLWDSLGLGMKALMWSAEVSAGEEIEEGALQGAVGWGMGLLSLGLGIALFMVLPSLLVSAVPVPLSSLAENGLEGAIRVLLIIGYIWAVGRLSDIGRVFAYHGAEHKTINAYEAGAPLTVEGVRPFTTAHPRCGTAFLLTVAVVSVLVLAPLGRPPLLWRVVSRVLLLPLIAGLAYEFIRFSSRHGDSAWLRWMIGPNMALQRLTTREPTDDMLEVAIRSLGAVLEAEEGQVPAQGKT
jgi:uncharacterized protein YqhQ